jgi:hypothetical protein
MAADLVIGLHRGLGDGGIALDRHRHREQGQRNFLAPK